MHSLDNDWAGKMLQKIPIIKGKKLLIFPPNFSTYRVGTCYTSSECASKSGKAAGNCAAG